jgi:intracellular septation protein A
MSAPTTPTKPKQENALVNLMLNVLLPVTILSYCSKETGWHGLGPTKALIIAVALPVAYQIWDWFQRRKINAFSIIGMISVLITGGLGLMKLNPQAFALKEAAIPLILGLVMIWTHKAGKPLAKTMLLNPDMMDVAKIEGALDQQQQRPAFEQLMWQTTLILAGSFVVSAVLNYGLALYFLNDKEPGSEEYTAGIGKVTGWGFLVIGVPMMVCLIWAFLRLTKGLQKLTGLTQDDIMLPR